jgi:hypothetical protein
MVSKLHYIRRNSPHIFDCVCTIRALLVTPNVPLDYVAFIDVVGVYDVTINPKVCWDCGATGTPFVSST